MLKMLAPFPEQEHLGREGRRECKGMCVSLFAHYMCVLDWMMGDWFLKWTLIRT